MWKLQSKDIFSAVIPKSLMTLFLERWQHLNFNVLVSRQTL